MRERPLYLTLSPYLLPVQLMPMHCTLYAESTRILTTNGIQPGGGKSAWATTGPCWADNLGLSVPTRTTYNHPILYFRPQDFSFISFSLPRKGAVSMFPCPSGQVQPRASGSLDRGHSYPRFHQAENKLELKSTFVV